MDKIHKPQVIRQDFLCTLATTQVIRQDFLCTLATTKNYKPCDAIMYISLVFSSWNRRPLLCWKKAEIHMWPPSKLRTLMLTQTMDIKETAQWLFSTNIWQMKTIYINSPLWSYIYIFFAYLTKYLPVYHPLSINFYDYKLEIVSYKPSGQFS